MKILFLDVDGVLNCQFTPTRNNSSLGTDPYMCLLVHRICIATGCQIVLSSSWRHMDNWRENLQEAGCQLEILDRTPRYANCKRHGVTEADLCRGHNIKEWLMEHPEVERYAILDDSSEMLDEQLPNFFRTSFTKGLTEDIAEAVIAHLNGDSKE